MKDIIQEHLEKEIKKWSYSRNDITGKTSRVKEAYDYKKEILETKLKQHKKTKSLVRLEFRHAYNKCKNDLEEIKSQKPRENCTPRDFEQRMDEILLIYSSIFNVSVNEARKELSVISSNTKEKEVKE